jgi:hypothetical protein
MLTMAPGPDFSFSDLLQQPTRVADAVQQRGRVLLHRRNAPDLVLSRASEFSEFGSFARLLARMVSHLPAEDISDAVVEALPWTRYLNGVERTEFVSDLPAMLQDCEDLGTFAPLEIYLNQWRNTAAILADPEFADRLSKPIAKPLGTPVAAP